MEKANKHIINKYFLFCSFILLLSIPNSLFSQNRDCVNAGLESNSFVNWSGFTATYTGATNLNDINSGLNFTSCALPNAPRITLTTPGLDPNVPIQRVFAGNYAIRLGSNATFGNAERVSYTVPITNLNKIFRYNYAVVLQIPPNNDHLPGELPFFSARVLIGKTVICATGRKTAGVGDPFFQNQGAFSFRDWDCQVCDLSAYVGQTATIEFTVASCSLGGHFGYAYIDGLCAGATLDATFHLNKNSFCLDEAITMDATATIGESYYYLTLEESDANGGRPNPASEMILYFPNQTVGIENITSIFQSNGFVFKCNTYYRLKLAVGNACSSWNEVVKVIYISCPKIDLGRDICLDCTRPVSQLIRIGDPNASTASHLVYQWSPAIGLVNPNVPYTSHMQGSVNYPITYTLTVTDTRSGCTNSDDVIVTCEVVEAKLIKESTCCGIKLTISAPDYYTHVIWSTGAADVNNITVTEAGIYTVTYSNSCSSVTTSITVTAEDIANIERYYTNLNDETFHHFYASPSNQNSYNAFYIMNVENVLPPYGEYYATEYKLEIYDRWGIMIRSIEGQISDCQGFPNPSILWDGTVNGTNVQIDVYNGRLYLKNCRHTEWKAVKVDYCEQWGYTCLDWDCEFGFGEGCGVFQYSVCNSWTGLHCVDQHKEYIFPINIIF